MDYKDQLVLTGEINNVGSSIMTNAPKSYRLGIEMQLGTRFLKIIEWNVNFSLSRDKIQDFVSYTDDWTNWPQQIIDTIGTTNISFSPSILANSSLSLSPVGNLSISLVSNFVGKQFIDNTSNNDRILPAYFVNNILINYSINTKFIRQIEFLVSLNNIFNTKYESNAWIYPYFYDGVEYEMSAYYPQAQFNLSAGITLKF
jgi:iron complex outermembrane receptor protein